MKRHKYKDNKTCWKVSYCMIAQLHPQLNKQNNASTSEPDLCSSKRKQIIFFRIVCSWLSLEET